MRTSAIFKSSPAHFFLLGLAFCLLIYLTKTSLFLEHPNELSLGVTLDFTLFIPLVYLLIIWKKDIPKITVVPVFILGLIVASFVLPENNQRALELIKTWILPIIEISVVTIIGFKVRKTIIEYKKQKNSSLDFYDALTKTVREVLPKKMQGVFITEIAVFYYALFAWKKKTRSDREFTYHKGNGILMLLGVLIFLILFETFALHILLIRWSTTVAWIFSGISIYTAFQLIAFMKAILRRPILIKNESLHLRFGILNEVMVPIKQIEKIELTTKSPEDKSELKSLSLLKDIDPFNTVIHLKEPHSLKGLYGIERTFRVLTLHLDEKENFKECLNILMNEH